MKNKNDINHIRLLLDRYYQAESTREEEDFLANFFIGTDKTYLPEDMLPDRELFLSMQKARPKPTEYDVPASLLERLDEIVGTPVILPPVSTPTIWLRVLRYAGIATVAVIVLAVVAMLPRLETHTINEDFVTEIDDNQPVTPSDESLPLLIVELNEWHAASGQANEDYSYIEITDPAEAQKIAIEIGKLLTRNAQCTNEALSQIGNTINSYKEITKSILQ